MQNVLRDAERNALSTQGSGAPFAQRNTDSAQHAGFSDVSSWLGGMGFVTKMVLAASL